MGTAFYNGKQHQLAERGQITDRFTKAVEQLGQSGPEKIDVRLGAIYALQRIMRDSKNDQPAVVDILSAFVRVHASAPPRTPDGRSRESATPQPVDIQAVLTVLARREPSLDGDGLIDLSQTNLILAAMPSAKLPDADMHGANLSGADLRYADLSGTDLSDAVLDGGTDLSGAQLRDVDLHAASLSGVYLRGATLSGADLRGADLSFGADLRDTDLRGAHLSGANLSGANLSDADLRGAYVDAEQVRCAYLSDNTRLPETMKRPTPTNPLWDSRCEQF